MRFLIYKIRATRVLDEKTIILQFLEYSYRRNIQPLDVSRLYLDTFIILLDLTNIYSIQEAKTHLKLFQQAKPPQFACYVLVGNKADVESRTIPYKQAKDLADSMGCKYFETSCVTGANVTEAVDYAFHDAVQR
jgi:hypothetical protein